MNTITFTCEVITPMFLAGADGKTPELRAPSIKGVLRFWWRAMHGYLSSDELRQKENEIFGGGGDDAKRSSIIIKTTHFHDSGYKSPMLPHKPIKFQSKREAYKPETNFEPKSAYTFDVFLSLTRENNGFNLDQLEALFTITCLLGGFGKRTRRGFGSIMIIKKNGVSFFMPSTIQDILLQIEKFNNNYKFDDQSNPSKIVLSNSAFPERLYPYIEEIQLGLGKYLYHDDFVYSVGDASHNFKSDDPSLGFADGSRRFASPVYVSSLKQKLGTHSAIITTLHMATKDHKRPDRIKQEAFKNAIL